jgi:hypothetical protein
MSVANQYIAKMEGEHKQIAQKVVNIIRETLPKEIKEEEKWEIPVWYPVIGILDTKKFVSLWLWKGGHIKDPKKKLVGDGKHMKRWPIHKNEDLDEAYLRQLLIDSIAIIA